MNIDVSTDSAGVCVAPPISSPDSRERAMMERMSRMNMKNLAEDIDRHLSSAKLVARIL